MTTHERSGQGDGTTAHDGAAAYALGILDEADATAFEAHLATCHVCALHLEEFAGMEPMLAMLADHPDPSGQSSPFGGTDPFARPTVPYGQSAAALYGRSDPAAPPSAPAVTVQPSHRLLDRLVDEVAVKRAARRRRSMYLVAAAAALVIGGPAVAVVATSGGGTSGQAAGTHPTSPAEDAFFEHMTEKVRATDPATKVSATVGMEPKGWGTHAVLELKNVKGPLKCNLIAVSRTGEEEIVTSWTVPKWGYGIPDSAHESAKNPLYVHGGAAMDRNDIDHFEVRTFDGKRLVEVAA